MQPKAVHTARPHASANRRLARDRQKCTLNQTRSRAPGTAQTHTVRPHMSANGQYDSPDGNLPSERLWEIQTRSWAKVRKSLQSGEKWVQLRNQGHENRKPFKICHLHIRMLSSSHSKCHSHMRPRNLHIAPTQNMSSTYNAKETIYFSSHSVSCKNMSSQYFGQFQKPLIIYQIRDFWLRDTSIHTVFKTCLLYQLQPFLKQILRRCSFDNLIC